MSLLVTKRNFSENHQTKFSKPPKDIHLNAFCVSAPKIENLAIIFGINKEVNRDMCARIIFN